MLRELLTAVSKQAVQAHGLKVTELPDRTFAVLGPDGEFATHPLPPPRRDHSALDFDTVAMFFVEDDSEIWYSRDEVVCFPHAVDRLDNVTRTLAYTEPMQFLMATPVAMKQVAFLRLLKIQLRDCVSPDLADAVRKIKFSVVNAGDADIAHGKVSMGRRIEAELAGTVAIPEYVTVRTRIWEGYHADAAIECALEIDAQAETFKLTPMPGQVEDCIRAGEAQIRKTLANLIGEGAPGEAAIYYGSPE